MIKLDRGLGHASGSTGAPFEFLLALAPLKAEMLLEILAEVAPPVVLLVTVVEVVAAEAAPAMVLPAKVAPPMVLLVAGMSEDPPTIDSAPTMVVLAEVASPPPPTIESATLATLSLELPARRWLSEDFEAASRNGPPTQEENTAKR